MELMSGGTTAAVLMRVGGLMPARFAEDLKPFPTIRGHKGSFQLSEGHCLKSGMEVSSFPGNIN